jgi:metallo-beta-lactamase family protein
LVEALLEDSARIQESDVAYVNKKKAKKGEPLIEPLYTPEDAEKAIKQLQTVAYDAEFEVTKSVKCYYSDAGHILGSASVHLTIMEQGKSTRVTFSGDVGRYNDSILKSPAPFSQADYILLESTYGDTLHVDYNNTKEHLLEQITNTCLKKGGSLVIPAFSVGRTQELLYALNALELEGRLPAVDYIVDSPLSIRVTEIIKEYPEVYNKHATEYLNIDKDLFQFKGLRYIEKKEESMALNQMKQPMVIISASGMAEAGRIKHHIKNKISDPKNTIMLVGYCNPEGLGGRLLAGDKQVKIFTEWYNVQAEVASMRSMSAHGDYEDLIQYLMCQDFSKLKKVFLVHGDKDTQKVFAKKLLDKGIQNVEIPFLHQEFDLN